MKRIGFDGQVCDWAEAAASPRQSVMVNDAAIVFSMRHRPRGQLLDSMSVRITMLPRTTNFSVPSSTLQSTGVQQKIRP